MNTYLIIGSQVVAVALLSYALGVFLEQRKRVVSIPVLTFISFGVLADITATLFMVAGSSKGLITLHGLIGYSALLAMLIDCISLWQFRIKNGGTTPVKKGLHLYSRYAFVWWVAAFITGGALAMMN
ncbi:MAG: hypothetical protein P4L28_11405 [Paludibacteraceae bacterium]|nr:hypothetical protein [Paludibacteraceae bacterium]